MENRIVSNVLEKNVNFLSRHLILSPTVIERLKEDGVITESVKRQLAFKDTDEQVPFLVHNLRDRGLLTFRKFLAVLRETGHGWMVDNLLSAQALSYEELASAQGGPRGLAEDHDPRSRLQGMTPEHARMRLTSAGLRGRGGGVTDPGYEGSGNWNGRYDNSGLGRTGLGLEGDSLGLGRRPEVGFRDMGLGGLGADRAGLGERGIGGLGSGLGNRGMGGLGSGLGNRGIGGDYDGLGNPGSYNSSLVPRRDPLNFMENRTRLGGGGSAKYRGQVLPGSILGDTRALAREGPQYGGGGGNITDALVNIHDHFSTQTDTNEKNLTILKREEMAIKELLEQNSREQSRVRRNQNALSDISRRLEEVNMRAHDVHDPVMHAHLSRYRLNQLNQIPWSADR